MGIIGDALDDMFDKIEDFVSFFIIYSMIVFILGQYFGVLYRNTSIFDYPLWLLFIAVLLYALKELSRKPKKK